MGLNNLIMSKLFNEKIVSNKIKPYSFKTKKTIV